MYTHSVIEASEKLKQQSSNFPESGGIWTAFRPGERGNLNKNFPIIQMPAGGGGGGEGSPGGDVEASIWLVH